jgi:hypothetical protein
VAVSDESTAVSRQGGLLRSVAGLAPRRPADLNAELLLVHGADGGQVHAGDQLLVQLALVLQEALFRRQLVTVALDAVALDAAHGSSVLR